MLEFIRNLIFVFTAFSTPYPYLLILAVCIWFLLFFVAFAEIKNGFVGWISAGLCLSILLIGVVVVGEPVFTPKGTDLDGRKCQVEAVSRHGLHLESGETILPAGITLGDRLWVCRQAMREMDLLIGGRPVRLDHNSRLHGYEVYTADGVNIAHHLLSAGLAFTDQYASDEMCGLESEARKRRAGYWSTPVFAQAHPADSDRRFLLGVFTMCGMAFLVLSTASLYVPYIGDKFNDKEKRCSALDSGGCSSGDEYAASALAEAAESRDPGGEDSGTV